MNTSETPRTDAVATKAYGRDPYFNLDSPARQFYELARTLEHELASAQETIKAHAEAINYQITLRDLANEREAAARSQLLTQEAELIRKERVAATALSRAERLREALTKLSTRANKADLTFAEVVLIAEAALSEDK